MYEVQALLREGFLGIRRVVLCIQIAKRSREVVPKPEPCAPAGGGPPWREVQKRLGGGAGEEPGKPCSLPPPGPQPGAEGGSRERDTQLASQGGVLGIVSLTEQCGSSMAPEQVDRWMEDEPPPGPGTRGLGKS